MRLKSVSEVNDINFLKNLKKELDLSLPKIMRTIKTVGMHDYNLARNKLKTKDSLDMALMQITG